MNYWLANLEYWLFECMKALAIGAILGVVATGMGIPIPVPESVVGLAGILGIWLGFVLANWLG